MLNEFWSVVVDAGLSNLSLKGYIFTRERGHGTTVWVEERLDRALVSHAWRNLFPTASLVFVEYSSLDHLSIFLDPRPVVVRSNYSRSRFDNNWLREEDCRGVVQCSWTSSRHLDILKRFSKCSKDLSAWNSNKRQQRRASINTWKFQVSSLRRFRDAADVATFVHAKRKLQDSLNQ